MKSLIFSFIFFNVSWLSTNAKPSEPNRLPVIIGGVEADISEFPHQVALYHFGKYQCGGSVLSEKYILTAAHCVDSIYLPAEQVTIRGGSSNNENGGEVVPAQSYIKHPLYDSDTFSNDVAIIELAQPLSGINIQPIQLVDETFAIDTGERAVVSGWGKIDSGIYPEQLMKVNVPIVLHEECDKLMKPEIFENMICAGVPGKDSCNGDSGGPLTYETESGQRVQIAVVSFGPAVCGSSVGVYSYLAHPEIRSFIRDITDL